MAMSSQIICALSYSGHKLGAVVYDDDEKEIKLIAGIAEDTDFIMLTRLLREFKPTHILANRAQEAEYQIHLRKECNYPLCEALRETTAGTGDGWASSVSVVADSQLQEMVVTSSNQQQLQDDFSETGTALDGQTETEPAEEGAAEREPETDGDCDWCPSLIFLPNVAFGFGLARKRLEQVFDDGMHNDKLLVSFKFDMSATNMIRSIGALFRFLEQQKAGSSDSSECDIRASIKAVTGHVLQDCVEVDSVTLRALEIFHSDYTPQAIRQKFVWGNQRREGMSIFKLCNVCRSTPGKHMLRMWFELPTSNRQVLRDRHEAIGYLYHDCNVEVANQLRSHMKDITSIRGIFRRMNRGNLPISDWKNLFMTVCALSKIGTLVSERELRLAILGDKMRKYFGAQLREFVALLSRVIDFQESLAENRLVIRKGVDRALDEKKELYEQLPEELTDVARAEATDICIERCSVAYVPIIGYLLMTPESMEIPPSTAQLVELIFSSEGMSYYKTKRMRLLDEGLVDIKMQIVDLETNIVLNLQQRVLQSRHLVLSAVEVAATLDCVTALSAVARKYNWKAPTLVEHSVLAVEQARHPISEHLCKSGTYIANPIFSSNEVGRVKILSGPNASGKSVYLKMVGVIVYLAYVGSFVPAHRAVIGPINRILSRLYTVDSVLDGMSSFANDLKQMSRAITRSDHNSLLIIDEFGKGTLTLADTTQQPEEQQMSHRNTAPTQLSTPATEKAAEVETVPETPMDDFEEDSVEF